MVTGGARVKKDARHVPGALTLPHYTPPQERRIMAWAIGMGLCGMIKPWNVMGMQMGRCSEDFVFMQYYLLVLSCPLHVQVCLRLVPQAPA